jgi:hypothetical protein
VRRKIFSFLVVLAVAVAAISAWEWPRIRDASLVPRCAFYGITDTYELSPEQTSNAATIAAVAIRRGLPKRATTVALAAALQESKLISLDYGDRDSVGLFQQRPSQGWGPKQSLIDPVYSSNKFFSALIRHLGWQQLSIADAAQAVQHSAAGSAYTGWEPQARVMSETLTDAPYSMTCYLHRYGSPSDALAKRKTALSHDLRQIFGLSSALQTHTWGFSIASQGPKNDQIAGWLVANADRFGIASVDTNLHSWSRREWRKNSHDLRWIEVRFL